MPPKTNVPPVEESPAVPPNGSLPPKEETPVVPLLELSEPAKAWLPPEGAEVLPPLPALEVPPNSTITGVG